MSVDHNLDVALRLAEAGLHVLPVAAAGKKRPLIRDWDTNSTTDPATIRTWWRIRRGALVAIDLRKAGLLVIDADRHGGPDGVDAWRDLVQQHSLDVLAHPITRTPNDGLHVYFRQPEGDPLRCRAGALPKGIEVKGTGGNAIAPHCIKADGTFYDPTEVDLVEAFASGTIPPVPDWLADLIRWKPEPVAVPPPRFTNGAGRHEAYAMAALNGQIASVSAAPNGSRNHALNAAAFRLGRMAARGWLERHDIEAGLRFAAQSNGLLAEDGAKGVDDTIQSGLCAGLANPAADPRGR